MDRRQFIKGGAMAAGSSLLAADGAVGQTMRKSPDPAWPDRIVKPPRLNKGDTVGLITPASAISKSALKDALNNMEKLGFKPYYSPGIHLKKGFLAGTDRQRVDDLHAMFSNDDVKGIFCARGGYGSARLLNLIDFDLIAANPKALIGFSDITALHFGIFGKTGLVSYHGPVGYSEFTNYTHHQFDEVVMAAQDEVVIAPAEADPTNTDPAYTVYSITGGVGRGQLVGGNLSLVASLTGTPFDLDFSGKIVFLEEVEEKTYRIDRMLTQLLLAGKLQSAAGIALGVFNNCDAKEDDSGLLANTTPLADVLADRLGSLGIPVIYGLSFGHVPNNATLPMGIKAELNTYKQSLTLLERSTTR